MKVLIVTPSKEEIQNGDSKSVFFIKSIIEQIKENTSNIEVTKLDITDINISDVSISQVLKKLTQSNISLREFDIIHTFSMLPFLFRPFFDLLVISSFNIENISKNLKPFLPCTSCPGYARYDISAIESLVIKELYTEAYNNRKAYDARPWGWWRSLELDEDFKIKHIYVATGEKLSLQTHKFRSEIWTIAHGSGFITLDDKILPAEKGDVFKIEKGQIHRAEGGANGLHIVEVQTGEYLGEDDIIRLEDIYGRK